MNALIWRSGKDPGVSSCAKERCIQLRVVYALLVLGGTAGRVSNLTDYGRYDDAPECELFPRRRELTQLVPHHILRNEDRDVVLPVMNKEPQTTACIISGKRYIE